MRTYNVVLITCLAYLEEIHTAEILPCLRVATGFLSRFNSSGTDIIVILPPVILYTSSFLDTMLSSACVSKS